MQLLSKLGYRTHAAISRGRNSKILCWAFKLPHKKHNFNNYFNLPVFLFIPLCVCVTNKQKNCIKLRASLYAIIYILGS